MFGRECFAQHSTARRGRSVMSKALVLGAAALALSVGAASAQVGYPGYDYGGATVPLYGYAAPGYGYADTAGARENRQTRLRAAPRLGIIEPCIPSPAKAPPSGPGSDCRPLRLLASSGKPACLQPMD